MKILCAVMVCAASLVGVAGDLGAQDVEVLLLVPDHYGANLYLNKDDFEGFGWNVTVAGVQEVVPACPAYAGPLGCPPITVDLLVTEIADISEYDCLAIMPGSRYVSDPYGSLLDSPAALDLVSAAIADGLVVYAPCAGVRVLAAADVLDGVRVTGHSSYRAEYEAAGATYLGSGIPPVIDGNIVTSTRGLYFHEANSEAVAIALENLMAEGERS